MEINMVRIIKDVEIERVLLTAIRTCYSPNCPIDIYKGETNDVEKYTGAEFERLIGIIMKEGHYSVLEHINFTFLVSGVSRSLLAQLSRHRHISLSVQSQRYIKFASDGKAGAAHFVTPYDIKNNVDANATFEKALADVQAIYDMLCKQGISAENARAILPNATATNFVLTMNLRSLIEFAGKRTSKAAQSEIRSFAQCLKALTRFHYPTVDTLYKFVESKGDVK